MKRPDPKLKEFRREQIITIASQLFAKQNFHQVLMDDVARKAHLSKGTLYNYFKNKEELYFAIISYRLTHLLNVLKERLDRQSHPLINLRRTIIHIYSFFQKYPHFFNIWYKEKSKLDQFRQNEIGGLHESIRQLLVRTLQQGERSNLLVAHDSELVGDLILGMIDAAVVHGRFHPRFNHRERRIQLYEFVLSAIGTPQAMEFHKAGHDEPQILSSENEPDTQTYLNLPQS